MSERAFQQVRRAFGQMGRDLEDGRRVGFEAERAIAEAYFKIAETMARAETLVALARRCGGRDGGPIPGRERKPRRPDGGGPSPQPVPVRPTSPNGLAGGAEVPLDF